MVVAIQALRCHCADIEMELVNARRVTPFFGESLNNAGSIQTYCCPKCGAIAARTVAPEWIELDSPPSEEWH
jgi:hypothetical protein